MQRILIVFAFMLFPGMVPIAFGAAATYTIDPNATIPEFEVTHLGFTTQRGRFDRVSGTIKLNIAARSGSVDLTIDTTSLDMGSASWTAHLKDEGLFNVAKYPIMTYHSDRLIFQGNEVVAAVGQLTMIGVTRPVLVTVSNFKCGVNPDNKKPLCAGDVTAVIKRSDFGMTKYIGAVSDEVKVSVPVEAYKD